MSKQHPPQVVIDSIQDLRARHKRLQAVAGPLRRVWKLRYKLERGEKPSPHEVSEAIAELNAATADRQIDGESVQDFLGRVGRELFDEAQLIAECYGTLARFAIDYKTPSAPFFKRADLSQRVASRDLMLQNNDGGIGSYREAQEVFAATGVNGVPLDAAVEEALVLLEAAAVAARDGDGVAPTGVVNQAPAPTSPEGSPCSDGPEAPNRFWYKGQSYEMEPTPWRLLSYMWANPNAEEQALIDDVWGGAEPGSRALVNALGKANSTLTDAAYPRKLRQKSGRVLLD